MVNYSKEFIEKCKLIYPNEKGLHDSLERKAWIAQKILGNLFYVYKNKFIEDILNHDLSCKEINQKIKNLRIANKLEAESLTFDYPFKSK